MNNREGNEIKAGKINRPGLRKIGFILVALSFVLYGCLLLVPFLHMSLGAKALLTTGLVVSGELSFWVGGIILGREFVSKYRDKLNPLQRFIKGRDKSKE